MYDRLNTRLIKALDCAIETGRVTGDGPSKEAQWLLGEGTSKSSFVNILFMAFN